MINYISNTITNEFYDIIDKINEICIYHYKNATKNYKIEFEKKKLKKKMKNSENYQEWRIYAEKYDKFPGKIKIIILIRIKITNKKY